ncbi:MAG: hypothetical protein RL417_989 [Pseudomonadota bacterium]|jgi:RsmE family RNA methyltransferase
MNALILLPHEVNPGGDVVITGARVASVIREHDLTPGLRVTAAVLGGKLGHAKIIGVTTEEITATVNLERDPPPRARAELIVAVPRPQTVKKIIHLAATLGLDRLHFIRSLHTVKSYLQSSSLSPAGIEEEIVKGLGQAVDSLPPQVAVHRSFERFAEEVLPHFVTKGWACALTDTHGAPRISAQLFPGTNGGVAAIGPESGWSDFEREAFLRAGFKTVSLGERMLRVEFAAAVALAELGGLTRLPA